MPKSASGALKPPSPTASMDAGGAAASACAASALPYLLYFPDLDGYGETSRRQWAALDGAFNFYSLKVLPDDRSSFAKLVDTAEVGAPPWRVGGGRRAVRNRGGGEAHMQHACRAAPVPVPGGCVC